MDDPDQSAAARFPFDAIYKALCCHRPTVGDMLTGFLAFASKPTTDIALDACPTPKRKSGDDEKAPMEIQVEGGQIRCIVGHAQNKEPDYM